MTILLEITALVWGKGLKAKLCKHSSKSSLIERIDFRAPQQWQHWKSRPEASCTVGLLLLCFTQKVTRINV